MSEETRAKLRVEKISFADPITAAEGVATAVWEEMPLTLRDDEVAIRDEDPTESEVFSHELDVAIDYDVAGAGTSITGSFVGATHAQLTELLGGEAVSSKFHRSANRILLNKAIKFDLTGGAELIVPNAKGMVRTDMNVGFGGVRKYPFKFKALPGSATWDVDMIW